MIMNTQSVLEQMISRDVKKPTFGAIRDFDLNTYNGIIFSDQYFISTIPIKYKQNEKLEKLHKLVFFLARNYNIGDVKSNNGAIFFTSDTFERAGLGKTSKMERSRWIADLEKSKVITCVNQKYHFGGDSFSKLYIFNQIGIIKSYQNLYSEYLNNCEKQNEKASIPLAENVSYSLYVPSLSIPSHIGNKLGDVPETAFTPIAKVNDANLKISIPAAPTNSIMGEIRKYTHNTIDDFCQKLKEYNDGKKLYDTKRLKFNEGKTELSCRAYSSYIATKKEECADGSMMRTDRTLWRESHNLAYSFDIKSAVPRISHLLATGEWKDNNYDFYGELLKCCGNSIMSRENMKALHMRLRFGKNDVQSFNQFCFANRDYVKEHYPYGTESQDIWQEDVKPKMQKEWCSLYNYVEKLEGYDHSSVVFYFESYLELYVTWKLKQLGIECYNIYDEFFYDKPCDIESIIAEAANYVYHAYKEGTKTMKFDKNANEFAMMATAAEKEVENEKEDKNARADSTTDESIRSKPTKTD